MADKMEHELAEGIEQTLGGLKQADPGVYPYLRSRDYAPLVQGATVEQKLQAIEKLVAEIRSISAQIKGQLG